MTHYLNKYSATFVGLLSFHILVLLYMVGDLSIAAKEIVLIESSLTLSGMIGRIIIDLFGYSIVALKLPFIILYLLSAIVLYLLTDGYFRYHKDRILSVALFMILPGVNSAALLLNESIIVIFCTLVYLYLYKKTAKENYYLLVAFLFIDNSFAILYLALFFYSLKKRDAVLLLVSLISFGISMSVYGFEIGGRPRGYFVDTLGIYASIFSPLLFLYFFYAIYRYGVKFERDIFWYLSMTALVLSFIFSLRQKVYIEDFAPFVVVAIPVMVRLYHHSVRVRIREHQTNYRILGLVLLIGLVLNFVVFVANKSLYLVLENPKKHFAYDYHIAKDLASELKREGIFAITAESKSLQKRLAFYGIKSGGDRKIIEGDPTDINYDIAIEYFEKPVAVFDIVSQN